MSIIILISNKYFHLFNIHFPSSYLYFLYLLIVIQYIKKNLASHNKMHQICNILQNIFHVSHGYCIRSKKSVKVCFCVYPSPILLDPVNVPAKYVLVGRHAYCGILKHHMLVGDAPLGFSWNWTQLFLLKRAARSKSKVDPGILL